MDAQLKKIQVVPVTFDKDGDVAKDEHATLTFEVSMDTKAQREAVVSLFELLRSEFVSVEVSPYQLRTDDGRHD